MFGLYPINVDLTNRDVLVVGGGPVAARKMAGMLGSGARITVVAPEVSAELDEIARGEAVSILRRRYQASDLEGKWLAIAATDAPELNRAVSADAACAHVFCNVVDQPALCSFQVPAVFRRGLLQIAISTGGASPALAKRIRIELEGRYGPAYGRLLEALLKFREHLQRKYPEDQTRRRHLLESFLDSVASDLSSKDGDAGAFLPELERWKSR